MTNVTQGRNNFFKIAEISKIHNSHKYKTWFHHFLNIVYCLMMLRLKIAKIVMVILQKLLQDKSSFWLLLKRENYKTALTRSIF